MTESGRGLYQCITCHGPSDGPGECSTCLDRPRDFAKYLPRTWSEEERQAAVSSYLLRVYGPGSAPDDVRAVMSAAWQQTGSDLEETMRRSGIMARIEDSRARPERLVPLDLDEYAEAGQTDGGVVLCAVCGDEADGQCANCDRDLCENHLRITAVPGDSFCLPGEGCSPKAYQ